MQGYMMPKSGQIEGNTIGFGLNHQQEKATLRNHLSTHIMKYYKVTTTAFLRRKPARREEIQ
jgi:hypothetical protein